jgi:hypothetical protein
MIDSNRVTIVLCLAVVAIVFVNLMIFSLLRRGPGNSVSQIEIMRRAAKRARQPWQEEDDNLAELSRQVAALKQPPNKEQPSTNGEPINK